MSRHVTEFIRELDDDGWETGRIMSICWCGWRSEPGDDGAVVDQDDEHMELNPPLNRK